MSEHIKPSAFLDGGLRNLNLTYLKEDKYKDDLQKIADLADSIQLENSPGIARITMAAVLYVRLPPVFLTTRSQGDIRTAFKCSEANLRKRIHFVQKIIREQVKTND